MHMLVDKQAITAPGIAGESTLLDVCCVCTSVAQDEWRHAEAVCCFVTAMKKGDQQDARLAGGRKHASK